MRCRYCLHNLIPAPMMPGEYASVHGARCSNETGHRLAFPWFEVRPGSWEPEKRDLVIHSSEEHSSVWSLTDDSLRDLLDVVGVALASPPEPGEIGHHRREAASQAGIEYTSDHLKL